VTKVYAVFLCWTKRVEDYESLQAIFSTKEKAEEYIKNEPLDWYDCMVIKEYELDSDKGEI
jgi:hypothetical protein